MGQNKQNAVDGTSLKFLRPVFWLLHHVRKLVQLSLNTGASGAELLYLK